MHAQEFATLEILGILELLQSLNSWNPRTLRIIGIVEIIEVVRAQNDETPPLSDDQGGFLDPKLNVYTRFDLFPVRIVEVSCR